MFGKFIKHGSYISMARYLAWVFLVLVLGLAVLLSLMIGKSARDVILEKQYAFASLLGDSLNHQIYRRYTLPTLIGYGRIALDQPVQYERLDLLVKQIIHGMNVQELRIYDHNQVISYATSQVHLGRGDLASPSVGRAMTDNDPIFDLDMRIPFWRVFFMPSLENNTIILRTTYPLRIENRLTSTQEDGPVMGVMEFTQDITKDIVGVIRFQWSIIGITLISCLLIFSVLIFFLHRADSAMAERVKEKDRLQEKLYQHEKLAGMGRVVAGIAHEIRNPLGIICSSAELLLRRLKSLDEGSRGLLRAIFDESTRLSNTVTDFLDYARPRTPGKSCVDMGKVLEQVIVFMRPELERCGITLRWMQPEQVVLAQGDKELLYRAVYNIMSNAAQSLENHGVGQFWRNGAQDASKEIWVSLSDELQNSNEPSPLSALPESKEVCVIIRDNGTGFELADTRNYIDPFFTTKSSGSGLGLAIVNSIVESHEGLLELSNFNGFGSGAVIKIHLPCAK